MQQPISTAEQIQILLSGRAFEFTKAITGKDTLTGDEYKTIFTVTRQQVLDHVRAHGLPAGAWSSTPGGADGLHMVEQDGSYSVYFQERGIAFDKSVHNSRTEAEIVAAKWLLGLSGAGLYSVSLTPPKARWWSRFMPRFLR